MKKDLVSSNEGKSLSNNELDQILLTRCLECQTRGWEDFVDRFMGLVFHVIDHTTQVRNLSIDEEQRDRLCEDVFAVIDHDSFRHLREYDGQCSLTTYMTILARRNVVRILLNQSAKTSTATRRTAA